MNSSATATNKKLSYSAGLILLMLSILDAVFTHVGLQGGHITEANPLMSTLYDLHVGLFFVVKILLPLVLLNFLIKRELNPYIQLMIAGTIFLYTFVLMMHIYWFTHLFM